MPVMPCCCKSPKGFIITLNSLSNCGCIALSGAVKSQTISAIRIIGNTYYIPVILRSAVAKHLIIDISPNPFEYQYFTGNSTCSGAPTGTVQTTCFFSVNSDLKTLFMNLDGVFTISGAGLWVPASALSTTPQTVANSFSCGTPAAGGLPPVGDGAADISAVFGAVAFASSSATFSNAAQSGSVDFTSSADWVLSLAGRLSPTTFNAGYVANATVAYSWITITSFTSGTGDSTVTFSLAANGTGVQRSVFIAINDQLFAVIQNA